MKHDLTNKRFGKLVAVREGKPKYSRSNIRIRTWDCVCDCGKSTTVIQHSLLTGNTKSCGCGCEENRQRIMNKAGVHRVSYDTNCRLARIMNSMRQRCGNKNNNEYHRYGGRGITICDEWQGSDGIKRFIDWAMSHGYSDDLTIDRIDNNKGYSPENCKWSDRYEQMANTSMAYKIPYNGKTYTAKALGRELNISSSTIIKWFRRGNTTGEEIIKAIEKSIQIYPQTARFYGKKRALKKQ